MGVPDPGYAITARCDDVITISGKTRGEHPFGMPREAKPRVTCLRIPESCCPIVAGSKNQLAVGRIAYGTHRIRVSR